MERYGAKAGMLLCAANAGGMETTPVILYRRKI